MENSVQSCDSRNVCLSLDHSIRSNQHIWRDQRAFRNADNPRRSAQRLSASQIHFISLLLPKDEIREPD
jgi:hypothetical protein